MAECNSFAQHIPGGSFKALLFRKEVERRKCYGLTIDRGELREAHVLPFPLDAIDILESERYERGSAELRDERSTTMDGRGLVPLTTTRAFREDTDKLPVLQETRRTFDRRHVGSIALDRERSHTSEEETQETARYLKEALARDQTRPAIRP